MDRNHDEIKNKAVLVFDLFGRKHSIESNEVEARKVEIKIRKEQDRNIVFAGDKICYKVTIFNDSRFDLCDLDFTDRLENDLKFERNSFKVNGEKKHAETNGQNVRYHINELKEKEEIVITFECEVE